MPCTSFRGSPKSRQTSRINWCLLKGQVRLSNILARIAPRIGKYHLVYHLEKKEYRGGHFANSVNSMRLAPPSAIVEAIQATGRDAILRGSGASNSRCSDNIHSPVISAQGIRNVLFTNITLHRITELGWC